ncbi:MAG: VCBS repeat-containing protein [Terracidiphilus sp.]
MIRIARTPMATALVFAVVTALPSVASEAGTVGTLSEDSPDEAPALIVSADFNGDGIADLAEVTSPDRDPSGPRYLTVLLGRGGGTFRQAGSRPVLGRDPRSIVVGDFNGDGFPDVIVGDGDGSLIELLGDGKGNLLRVGDVARLGSIMSIAVGDFDHDGILDLAVSDPLANQVTVFLGSGNGSFRPVWTFSLPTQGMFYHLVSADFNGDGLPDLAVVNEDGDSFEVMIGNGNGTFTYAPALSHVRDPLFHCVT